MESPNIFQGSKAFLLVNFALLITLTATLGINQFVMAKTHEAMGLKNNVLGQFMSAMVGSGQGTNSLGLGGKAGDDAVKIVLRQGLPEIYGQELGVSFDQVEPAMNAMKQFDPTYGQRKITLSGADLQRYINVGLKISCEYCCSAKAIISSNGQAACGCAHSQAMRGLLAYLIQNHPAEYSDDELLRELARWKGMYFPKQMIQKTATQLQGGNYTPDVASLVLGLDLPDYGGGSGAAPAPSSIENLPNMVGGC